MAFFHATIVFNVFFSAYFLHVTGGSFTISVVNAHVITAVAGFPDAVGPLAVGSLPGVVFLTKIICGSVIDAMKPLAWPES